PEVERDSSGAEDEALSSSRLTGDSPYMPLGSIAIGFVRSNDAASESTGRPAETMVCLPHATESAPISASRKPRAAARSPRRAASLEQTVMGYGSSHHDRVPKDPRGRHVALPRPAILEAELLLAAPARQERPRFDT